MDIQELLEYIAYDKVILFNINQEDYFIRKQTDCVMLKQFGSYKNYLTIEKDRLEKHINRERLNKEISKLRYSMNKLEKYYCENNKKLKYHEIDNFIINRKYKVLFNKKLLDDTFFDRFEKLIYIKQIQNKFINQQDFKIELSNYFYIKILKNKLSKCFIKDILNYILEYLILK